MKVLQIFVVILIAVLFLTGCTSYGSNFFIRNYEENAITIQYKYFEFDNISKSIVFDYQPKDFVLQSNQILPNKVLKNFPYKASKYFDTIPVRKIDSLNYTFNIAPKNTIHISPVFMYGDNIEFIVLNNTDTIKFKSDYPNVEAEELYVNKLFQGKGVFVGQRFILNLKLDKIKAILNQAE